MKDPGRTSRELLLPAVVVLAVWCVFVGAAVAGIAARTAVGAQDQLLQRASEVSIVLADAGRAEALVAAIGDPKTNPATLDEMRAELAGLARSIHVQSVAWRGQLDASSGAGPATGSGTDPTFAAAVRRRGPQLLELANHFADTAGRAASPQAQVAPGQLLRGSLDGDYSVLRSQAVAVHAAIRASAGAADERWSRLVSVVLTATATAGIALTWLMLGPVRRRLARQRRDAARAHAARDEALNAVRRVLDALDVPVLVVDARGVHVDANACALARFGFLRAERTLLADLPEELFLSADGHPIGWRELPIAHVLRTNAAVSTLATLCSSTPSAAAVTPPVEVRYSVDVQPVNDVDGRVLGAVASFQDITALHARAEHHARHAAQLAIIREATSAILRQDDARAAVCEAARAVAGAAFATLFEDDGHGDLVCTASAGADAFGMRMPINGRSITAATFAQARSHTANALDSERNLDREAVAALSRACGQPVNAGAWIPVTTAGRCRAVLALGFTQPQPVDDYLPTLEVLAGEAAVALDRQDLIRRLAQDAEIDPLTGAANRRAWDTHLNRAVEDAAASGRPLSLIMLDLDHFKNYNDTHGHPAGDALLRRVSSAWRDRLRPGDVLARYGGEEFVALLPDCSLHDAHKIADDLRRLVPDPQTCSAGVAQYVPGEDPLPFVGRADTALYRAKRDGRNRTVLDTAT